MSEDKIGVDILAEFIEVAIHCILYNRNLYPQGVFEKRVKYNVPVQMCLHPDVCGYIGSVLDSLKTLISKGRVDKVSVVILQEETNLPIERFVLEVGDIRDSWKQKDPHLFKVEQALRSFLLKLNVSDALLQPARKGTTWTVHAHTMNSTLAAADAELIQKDFPWIEAEEKHQKIENAKIVPIRSMTSDIFSLQLYAEEASNMT
ncbi:hypothetical protein BsWGS_18223 [Bradybaena similaris]